MSGPASARLRPVWREILCDGDTPVGAYAKLRATAGGSSTFLLESVVGGERWARYSFLGTGYRARVTGRWQGDRLAVEIEPGPGFEVAPSLIERVRGSDGPDAVRAVLEAYAAHPPDEGLPRFWGGLVGVFGHDYVRAVERLPAPAHGRTATVPAFELLLTDTLVVFDNLSQRVQVVATACPATDGGEASAQTQALARIDAVVDRLRGPASLATLEPREVDDGALRIRPAAPWDEVDYPAGVRTGKEYIAAGDVFQLVLSQRFDQPRDGVDPLDVYRVLRMTNPSPYMYLLDLPSATLAGASPEVLVRVDRDDRRVTVRPIAGTRRRGSDPEEDLALERELLEDPKERAEHVMLIDLGRNDVGRVSEAGTVKVEESFVIERYSRVMHIVSEVSGSLRPEFGALEALAATFPAGTLSGAPKVRALELIDELEPDARGWYGGAVGYLGYDGGADFAICIRSVVFDEASARVQAGAGIVFDSNPEAEDEECRRKASAVLRALAMARPEGVA